MVFRKRLRKTRKKKRKNKKTRKRKIKRKNKTKRGKGISASKAAKTATFAAAAMGAAASGALGSDIRPTQEAINTARRMQSETCAELDRHDLIPHHPDTCGRDVGQCNVDFNHVNTAYRSKKNICRRKGKATGTRRSKKKRRQDNTRRKYAERERAERERTERERDLRNPYGTWEPDNNDLTRWDRYSNGRHRNDYPPERTGNREKPAPADDWCVGCCTLRCRDKKWKRYVKRQVAFERRKIHQGLPLIDEEGKEWSPESEVLCQRDPRACIRPKTKES